MIAFRDYKENTKMDVIRDNYEKLHNATFSVSWFSFYANIFVKFFSGEINLNLCSLLKTEWDKCSHSYSLKYIKYTNVIENSPLKEKFIITSVELMGDFSTF